MNGIIKNYKFVSIKKIYIYVERNVDEEISYDIFTSKKWTYDINNTVQIISVSELLIYIHFFLIYIQPKNDSSNYECFFLIGYF